MINVSDVSEGSTPNGRYSPERNVLKTLEYPLPILKLAVSDLVIEAQGNHQVTFNIRNTGGGTLEGRIISPNAYLSFEPEQWEGNRKQILCRFSPNPSERPEGAEFSAKQGTGGWRPGDVRTLHAQILSNGGEAVLPITVRLAKRAVTTKSGAVIANLSDFFSYAEKFPEEAQQHFADSDFFTLLKAMDFPYLDAYTLLTKEANRFRALDNFFILAGLKKRTALLATQLEIEHRSFDNSMIYGHFQIQKSDSGYAEANIIKKSPWLKLSKSRLKPLDFKQENTATIKYSIDPLLITGRYAREIVTVESQDDMKDTSLEIIFKRPLPLKAWLPREGYRFKDEGIIMVENKTNKPIMVQLSCNEAFIRFFQQEYKVEGRLQIPFIVKLPPLQSAQMLFRKIPSLFANIEVKAVYKDTAISKTLSLTAGEW